MIKDTATYCFGRFLIDLPKTAEVNGQAYEFMFGKVASERFPKGEEAFAQKMKERGEELKAGKHEEKFDLTSTRTPSSAPNSKVFGISKKLFVTKITNYGFEAYRLVF